MTELSPSGAPLRSFQAILIRVLQLLAVGLLVGIACWPLNMIDGLVDQLLSRLPAFASGSASRWNGSHLAMVLAPLAVMPLLLWLQSGHWRQGSGSGIPQTIASIEDPAQMSERLAGPSTVQRLTLWSVASFALLPLGREGPVVQVGAAVAAALRQRWPRLLAAIEPGQFLAVGAGAGLAAGFNAPAMALMFILEELLGQLQARLVWPGLVICSVAAVLSGLLGQPQYALGELTLAIPELEQLLWALPIGCVAGLIGGLFARTLVISTGWLTSRRLAHPWRWGLILGAGVSALLVVSGGAAGGDGETLLKALLSTDPGPVGESINQPLGALWLTLQRLIGPVLPLAAGVPGGLIDPALTLGAMAGSLFVDLVGHDHQIGLVFGMAAGLAGATQLPLVTIAFVVRLVGDQELLYGLVMASAIGAFSGRLLLRQPVYHALAALQRAPRR